MIETPSPLRPGAAAANEESAQLLLPTRVIAYAWGEKYVGELLSLTLPALLAPGNLPHVAARVPCEIVILTQRLFFPRFLADPVVVRIQQFCPVRLLPLDDLVSDPDKYGMGVTYALHRGLADFGAAVTDRWLIFLNADFILADGSLRTLLERLAGGARLVASPSYCANAESVVPVLLSRIDPQTSTLAVPPRELAGLVLRHRHNTIRGKTANQSLFSIRYMDQFYWEVDSDTLIGYQMPIAVVGMRPERPVPEPNSYWDHGLIREFVPTAAPCVLGDSDDFLMLEFRNERTAEDQLRLGWPDPAEIARNARSFLTPYQREMAEYPLTLHARDLPVDIEAARHQLRAFVDGVLAHLPPVLPSHLEHPQWDYHRPGFIRSRHEYLSRQLGRVTETEPPAEGLGEFDRLWWQLDGLRKSYERRRRELADLRDQQRGALIALQVRSIGGERNKINERLAAEIEQIPVEDLTRDVKAQIDRLLRLSGGTAAGQPHPMSGEKPAAAADALAKHAREWLDLNIAARARQEAVDKIQSLVDRQYEDRLATLDLEFRAASQQLQADYDQLMRRRVMSAAIPHVAIRHGPQSAPEPASNTRLERLVRRLYHCLFHARGRFTKIHPYWAPRRHLVRAVDRAASEGATDVLVVVGRGGLADRTADALPGRHAYVALADVLQGNLAAAFNRPPDIDLCLCNLDTEEIYQFSEIVRAVAPCLRSGGTVIGFHPNFDLDPLPIVDARLVRGLFDIPGEARIYYAGSAASARLLRRLRDARSGREAARRRPAARLAAELLLLAPRAFLANRAEDLAPEDRSGRVPDPCSSLTIEVTL